MPARPAAGDTAPDFELPGTQGTFRLSDHRGQPVVLLFYPGDNTPVCTRQFCSYRDHAEEVDDLGAIIVGISDQDLDSHEQFIHKHGLNVPLLADTDKAVAKQYGTQSRVLGTKRSVIVVAADGTIHARHDHLFGLDFLSVDQIRELLPTQPARAAGS
jgi:thioredoxin-dependent peroxiredoxin